MAQHCRVIGGDDAAGALHVLMTMAGVRQVRGRCRLGINIGATD